MIIYEDGEHYNVPIKWLEEHDSKVIDEFVSRVIDYCNTVGRSKRNSKAYEKLYKTLNIIATIAFILSVCCIDSDTIIPAIIAAISLLWLFPVAIRGCMNGEFEEN